MNVRPNRVGLVFAVFLGLFHAGWALLVLIGWAQPLIDFVFRLHFITPVYSIQPFNIVTALGLVAFTSFVGYVMGWVAGVLWNQFHKQ